MIYGRVIVACSLSILLTIALIAARAAVVVAQESPSEPLVLQESPAVEPSELGRESTAGPVGDTPADQVAVPQQEFDAAGAAEVIRFQPEEPPAADASAAVAGPVADAEPAAEINKPIDDSSPVDGARLRQVLVENAAARIRKPITAERAALIPFTGAIDRSTKQLFENKLRRAKALGVSLVVLEIDSPGGGLLETEHIAGTLRDLDWAQTVAYVPSEALSGAAILSLPCDEIVLGPNAEFGDAGAIYLGEGFMFQYADEKFRTALASRVRALAESSGRPPALAEAMVDMDLVVFQVQNRVTGERTCRSQAEIDSSPRPDEWQVLNPIHESRKEHFFQVTGRRAVELGLADATVDSRAALKARYQLQDDFIVLKDSFGDRVAVVLNHPLVTGLLFIVGLVALYIEFLSPGLGMGGVTSVLCFGLFFWSRFWGGTGDWLEVVLFLLGVGLMAVEVFVLPGFGVWGLTGLLLMLASLILASEDFVIPQTRSEFLSLQTNTLVALGAVVLFLLIAGGLTMSLDRIPGFSRLALSPPASETVSELLTRTAVSNAWTDSDRTATGSGTTTAGAGTIAPLPKVGDHGVADSALRPSGKARFADELHDVATEGLYVSAGSKIRVVRVQGTLVVVREIEEV